MQNPNLQTVLGAFSGNMGFRTIIVFACLNCYCTLLANPGYTPKLIDINKADTTVFISLPGIGSKLAARIINYRESLHGFYSVQQVGEVYGLADSIFQKIKPWLVVTEIPFQKININTAGVAELVHPYISYNLAKVIIQYRNQHGKFTGLEELKKIILIDQLLYNKIVPYLTLR